MFFINELVSVYLTVEKMKNYAQSLGQKFFKNLKLIRIEAFSQKLNELNFGEISFSISSKTRPSR